MKDQESLYEERILAFVDILGFKTAVIESVTNFSLQQRILSALENIHQVKKLNDSGIQGGLRKFGIRVTTFSDSAVISYPISFDGGLFFVLLSLIHLQIDLLTKGFFIRGGVTIGYAYHDEHNVFGPAMIEAYTLESKYAITPKIILTEETIKKGVENSPTHQNEHDIDLLLSLVRSEGDYYFLDYLVQHQEFNYPEYDYYDWLCGVREIIVDNLNKYYQDEDVRDQEKQYRVYEKYEWLMNYWNDALGSKKYYPAPDYLNKKERKELYKDYMDLKIDTKHIPYE